MGLFSDFLQKGNAFQPGGTGSITSSLVATKCCGLMHTLFGAKVNR